MIFDLLEWLRPRTLRGKDVTMQIEYKDNEIVKVERQDPKHIWKFARRSAVGMIEVYRNSRDGAKVFKAFKEAEVSKIKS